MVDNLHKGHRARLKARAAASGFDSLAPHEQVELLLFFAIPQSDTNPIAHRLIDRFGSLAGICCATEAELLAVEGIGAHTAALLRLIPGITRAFLEAEAAPITRYDTADRLEALLIRRYIGVTTESLSLVLLNARTELIAVEALSSGSIGAVSTTAREIIERAYAAHAGYVVLAHNHPGGLAVASADDLTATRQLSVALELTGIPLLEHFIIAENHALPLLMGENLRGRTVGPLDLRHFYASYMEVEPC